MIEGFAHVGDPAWLRAHNLFVAEGRLVVERVLAAGRFPIHSILLTPAARTALGGILPSDVLLHVVEQDVMTGITGFKFHRGCLALVARPSDTSFETLLTARRVLALEGVGNPDNIGGLFRVAAAFGVDGVLLDPACADPLYRKAIRTSMGAALHVPFARSTAWPSDLQRFRDAGFRVLALTPRADATSIDRLTASASDRWVLLAGAEGAGLTDAAFAMADERVRIDTTTAVDSLNVAVAAGIALSRLFRPIPGGE